MDDVHRHSGHLRHGDGAMDGFGLGNGGSSERVIDGRGLALGESLLDDDIDDGAVLGMHADERAVLRCLAHAL